MNKQNDANLGDIAIYGQESDPAAWRLAKSLKARIDEALIKACLGAVSLPFAPGARRRIAVKLVGDWGVESLKAVSVESG
ncbi:MAG: hypothetical protein J7M29_08215 [Verrucomicrobia bacterium]|nr:hypothetical protein [Verrucomicrobiota bacterium]